MAKEIAASKKEMHAMIAAHGPVAARRPFLSKVLAVWRNSSVSVSLFVLAAMLVSLPSVRAQQTAAAPPTGNAQNGKKLFMADGCYECHGREGQGAAQTGAARIGPPMLSFEGFQTYIRRPLNNMPPYTSKALPDSDAADIYAYLKSIPMPPKGKDIPLLNN
jgi:mono/diheme cytochrome c family protein